MQLKDIIKKVKQIEIRSKKKTEASLMGQYHSAFKGQGMTFAEVRQYQLGDDIRTIDWNKTAQFRDPFVKLMEEERELTVMFLVDISASMNYGTKISLKKEFVAEICASIGLSAIGNNDKVGLILFADKVCKVIPPQKGKKHLLAILSSILSADFLTTKTDVEGVLQYVMNVFKKKSLLFIFSDFNDEIKDKMLKITAKKHQLLGIRVGDEKDNEIPDIGYAEFQDSETGQRIWVNTSDARWRYTFTEHKLQQKRRVQELFHQSSAGFFDLNTGADYAKALYQYFKH